MIQFLISHPQEISNGVLVFVTAIYAYLTYRILKETRHHRMDAALPFLISNGFTINPDSVKDKDKDLCIKADFHNLGSGAALNIDISFYEPQTEELLVDTNHVVSFVDNGDVFEDFHIHIPHESFDNMSFSKSENGHWVAFLECVITYQDIYSRNFLTKQIFALDRDKLTFEPVQSKIVFKML